MPVANEQKSPLFVDLDGTFIKSDILYESTLIAIKKNPLILFKMILWLARGRAYLKSMLSFHVRVPVESIPLNHEFYSFLQNEKGKREIILATASAQNIASEFSDTYDVFSSFIGSTPDTNLKGRRKLERILDITDRFSYAGNSREDFSIFPFSEESFLVNPTPRAKRLASKVPVDRVFDPPSFDFRVLFSQLRVHQWLKNLLIFVPLLVSGSYMEPKLILYSALGFLSFNCLASSTYIINDLLDLNSDRLHLTKRNRPIAAGLISIPKAAFISACLLVVSFLPALVLSPSFFFTLLAYLLCTLSYSLKIKQYFGMDVIFLAALYTIRILSGAAILGLTVSFWLLSFSMFVFFSLALVKRCAELKSLVKLNLTHTAARDYTTNDYDMLASLGTASGLMSVLMFCFFTQSEALTDQYQDPSLIWLIIPALGYWLTRMWIKTHRGEMHEDPIVFSIKDKGSIITISFMIIITILGKFL